MPRRFCGVPIARRDVLQTIALVTLSLAGCARSPETHGYLAGADGVRLYYRVLGRGADTVVVLHGGPGMHHRYLVPALAPLATTHTLVFYDQRGRGRSDSVPDTTALTAERDVADLETLRQHFDLQQLTLVGHGWGGALAVHYAVAHPDRVRRLALVSPYFPNNAFLFAVGRSPYDGPDSAAFDGLEQARRAQRDQRQPRRFCREYWGAYLSPVPVRDVYATRRLAPEVCDAPPAALARAERVRHYVLHSLGPWDWQPDLSRITVPTILIQGRGHVWDVAARQWLAGLPAARLVTLRAHPQFPWLDEPGRFLTALDWFFRVTRPLPNRAGE
jgi:proline iminopeptidase